MKKIDSKIGLRRCMALAITLLLILAQSSFALATKNTPPPETSPVATTAHDNGAAPSPSPTPAQSAETKTAGPVLNLTQTGKIGSIPSQGGLISGILPEGGVSKSPLTYGSPEGGVPLSPVTYGAPVGVSITQAVSVDSGAQASSAKLSSTQNQVMFHYAITIAQGAGEVEANEELFFCELGDAFSNIIDTKTEGELTLIYDSIAKRISIEKNTGDEWPDTVTYTFAFTADVAPGTYSTLTIGGSSVSVERAASIGITMGWEEGGTNKGRVKFELLNETHAMVASAAMEDSDTTGVLQLYPSDLTAGDYTLRQTLDDASTSYIPCVDRIVTITKNSEGGLALSCEGSAPAAVLALNYTNRLPHAGSITINAVEKADRTTPITGARFKLERYITDAYQPYPDGDGIATVANNGILVFDNLPDGEYQITQQPLDAYEVLGTPIKVKIDKALTALISPVDVFVGDEVSNNPTNPIEVKDALTLVWESEQLLGSYTFIAKDGANTPLSGAGFTLYYPNQAGDGPGTAVNGFGQVLSADGTGAVLFSDIPYGRYFIKLTKAPAGLDIDHIPDGNREIIISASTQDGGDWVIQSVTGEITFLFKNDADKGIIGGKFKLTMHSTQGSIPIPLKSEGAIREVNNADNKTIQVHVYSYDKGNTDVDANVFATTDGYAIIQGLPISVLETISPGVNVEYDKYKITVSELPPGYTFMGAASSGDIVFDKTNIKQDAVIEGYPYVLRVTATNKNGTKTERPLSGAMVRIKKTASSEYVKTGALSDGIYAFDSFADTPDAGTTFTTNSDGTVLIEALPEGDYIVEQVAAPTGYELKSSVAVSIGTDLPTIADGRVTYEKNSEFDKHAKSLEVMSVNQNEKPVAGAKFTLYKVDGGKEYPIYLGASDANGVLAFDSMGDEGDTDATVFTPSGVNATALITGLPEGRYKLVQTFAPTDYEKMEPVELDISATLAPSLFASSSLNVSARKPIRFINASVTPNVPLDGAKFKVKKVNNDGTETELKFTKSSVDTYTLSDIGTETEIAAGAAGVILAGLGEGKYKIIQTLVPDGFVNPAVDPITFDIGVGDHNTLGASLDIPNVLETNEISFSIIKQDASNASLLLSGATFELQKLVSGSTYEKIKTPLTTSTSGTVQFTDLTEGTYRLEETVAPSGYKKWSNALKIVVNAEGEVRVNDVSTPLTPVTGTTYMYSIPVKNEKALTRDFAVKCTSSTTGAAISGAKFTLTSSSGASQTLTTGSNGESVYVALEYGNYTLKQTDSAVGFQAGTTSYTVVVDENGISVNGGTAGISSSNNKYLFTLTNAPGARSAMIYVRDGSNWVPIRGAVFNVSQRNAGNAWTLTSNANGYTGTFTITPGFTYDISQTTAATNYLLPSSGWTLTVAAGGGVSVTGSGITAYEQDGTLILRIDNTYSSTAGEGSGDSDGGAGSGGTPGIPRTGQYIKTDFMTLGAAMMLISCIGLVLFIIKSRRKEA